MRFVYGYVWGIWWWRTTAANTSVGQTRVFENAIPPTSLGMSIMRKSGLDNMLQVGIKRGIPQAARLDVVASGMTARSYNASIRIHQWNGFVPMWSLCAMVDERHPSRTVENSNGSNAQNGPALQAAGQNLVCSPEFCLLQIASVLKGIVKESLEPWQRTVILAELGCELCGRYSKQNTLRGFSNRHVPLTSVADLWYFAGRMAHERGIGGLREALVWVIDGSRSPMETTLYLMLCLPHGWGGMRLPRPFSNSEIEVPPHLWGQTPLRHIYPDLYWPEAGLIVEYDSDEDHSEKKKQKQDLNRRELAQSMGYKVVTFGSEDIGDITKFRAKAKSVAGYLGVGLPRPSQEFLTLQCKLRDMLARHERWL